MLFQSFAASNGEFIVRGFWIVLLVLSGAPAYALEAKVTTAPNVPSFISRTMPETVVVRFEATEFVGDLADGKQYKFWSFNGTVPGPMIRVRLGDTVEFRLSNHLSSEFPHNIVINAVNGPGGAALVSLVAPGEERVFRFKTLHPGLYIYRCASPIPSVAAHIANGMYGLLLVEPKHGFPRVNHEFYIFESEFYTKDSDPNFVFNTKEALSDDLSSINKPSEKYLIDPGVGEKTVEELVKELEEIKQDSVEKELEVFTLEDDMKKESTLHKARSSMYGSINEIVGSNYEKRKRVLEFSLEKGLRDTPDYVVFNGRQGALLGENALKVNVGDKVRIFFGNIGPNGISSFHITGEIFDRVYLEGAVNGLVNKNVQTTLVPTSGATILEFTIDVPGDYFLVDDRIFSIDKGAIGLITAVGKNNPDIFDPLE
jgi:FtsP/CotA-like multicopper oxidase with cupredoxin domain